MTLLDLHRYKHWIWCRSHVSAEKLREVARLQGEGDVTTVEHEWWRFRPRGRASSDPASGRYEPAKAGSRGAFAVTTGRLS